VENGRLAKLSLQLAVVSELPEALPELRVIRPGSRVFFREDECESVGLACARRRNLDPDLFHGPRWYPRSGEGLYGVFTNTA